MAAEQKVPRRRLSAEDRSLEIVEAARALALTDGLSAVTLRRVAGRLAVAPSLIAHYEPSMDDLVARTFAAVANDELAEVEALIRTKESPTARLRALIGSVCEETRDHVAALWADAWSIGRSNALLAASARRSMDSWQSCATGIVRDGVEAGEFNTEDPDEVGFLLFSLVDSASAYGLVDYRPREEWHRLLRRSMARAVGVPIEALEP